MRFLPSRAAGVLAVGCVLGAGPGTAEPDRRPNVVVIVADDLGYSDLGSYGGEIGTPHLDALARGGLRFTRFYNTGRCWPTRESLLSGFYAQQIRRDGLPSCPDMGRRPAWAPLLPALLRSVGYRSYHSGKWHVDGMPLQVGFDRSYLVDDQHRYFHPTEHYEDDRRLPPVPPGTGYYATTAIADRAIGHLRAHAQHHAGRPFFQLVTFTAPHFPLHALADDTARYRETYRRGWDEVRRARGERVERLGLVTGGLSAVERDVGPPYPFPGWRSLLGRGEVNRPWPWERLDDEQREFQVTKMALHAAMVARLDREVGRILDQLREMGALDDTLLLFFSDNGASAEIFVLGDGHDPAADPGSAATYLCLGPGWSTVSNTPFRRHKTWVHEGGISTPLIVHWPRAVRDAGALRRTPGHVIDLVPTVLEATGCPRPRKWNGLRLPPLAGRSLVPALEGDREVRRELLWWFHEGNRAVQAGDFKLVAAGPSGPWELYDLARDRAETKDLAASRPETLRELSELWWAKAREFAALAGCRDDTVRAPKGAAEPVGRSAHPAGVH